MPQARFNNRGQQKDIAQRRWKRNRYKDKYLSQARLQQPKTTEMVSHREDQKETEQGQVSQGQGSTTEDNRMVLQREDRKETAQAQVSQKQGSTTGDNRNISHREDRKERNNKVNYLTGR